MLKTHITGSFKKITGLGAMVLDHIAAIYKFIYNWNPDYISSNWSFI